MILRQLEKCTTYSHIQMRQFHKSKLANLRYIASREEYHTVLIIIIIYLQFRHLS